MPRAALLALTFLLLTATPAQATFRSWNGPLHDGKWNLADNWSPKGIPAKGDVVYLGGADEGRDITLDGTDGSADTVFGGAKLLIDGKKLTVSGGPDSTSFSDARLSHGAAI